MAINSKPAATADTRGQRETHSDERVMDDFFNDNNPYDVDRLPRLDGMTLQWHRISFMGENDTKNIMKSISRGWKPVLVDTLKQAALEGGFDTPYLPTTKFSEQEGVVGTYDLILMAIPTRIYEGYRTSIQNRVNLQQQSQDTIFNNNLNSNIPSAFVTPMRRGDIPVAIDD